MDNIARLSANERKDLFSETAARKGIKPSIAEKDFWVCWVLKQIFQDEFLSKQLMFKGGTSLWFDFSIFRRH
jgi:predicted nucleotidyltransferase component of viral defense system